MFGMSSCLITIQIIFGLSQRFEIILPDKEFSLDDLTMIRSNDDLLNYERLLVTVKSVSKSRRVQPL